MANIQGKGRDWIDLLSRISFWALTLILAAKVIYPFTIADPCANGEFTVGVNCGGIGAERLRIGLAAVLFLVFSSFPRFSSSKIISIPLLWIIGEYILWWIRSYNILAMADNPTFRFKGLFFLYNANWLDIGILIFVLISITVVFIRESTNQNMR